MEYEWDLTVPANTPESSPVVAELRLAKGAIQEGWIYFPLGCVHMVKARVFYHDFQIAPIIRTEWLKGEGARVPFASNFEIDEKPYSLTVKACSPGTTYDHTLTIHISLLPAHLVRPETVIVGNLKLLREEVGEFAGEVKKFMKTVKEVIGT